MLSINRVHMGVFVFGLAIISTVHGSGFGKCPNYPSMPKFNLTKVNATFEYCFFFYPFRFKCFEWLLSSFIRRWIDCNTIFFLARWRSLQIEHIILWLQLNCISYWRKIAAAADVHPNHGNILRIPIRYQWNNVAVFVISKCNRQSIVWRQRNMFLCDVFNCRLLCLLLLLLIICVARTFLTPV